MSTPNSTPPPDLNSWRNRALATAASAAIGLGIGGAAANAAGADTEAAPHSDSPHLIADAHQAQNNGTGGTEAPGPAVDGGAEAPVPAPTPRPPESPEPSGRMNLHPERLHVPSQISKVMHDNVVYLTMYANNGMEQCSGWLIRSPANKVVGIYTAEHCLDGLTGWPVATTSTGLNVHTATEPVAVDVGDNLADLKDVGQITQFVTGGPATSSDMAFGIMPGHTLNQVIEDSHLASYNTVAGLKQGTVVYNSGWPAAQKPEELMGRRGKHIVETYYGNARQEFAMSVIGTEVNTMPDGKQVRMLTTLVPTDKSEAICSPGESGSVAFILEHNKPVILGTMSLYENLDTAMPGSSQTPLMLRQQIEQQYNVDTTGYDAVCSFAIDSPTTQYQPPAPSTPPTSGAPQPPIIVQPGPIGGPEPIGSPPVEDPFEIKATQEFADPTYQKQIVNGYVAISEKLWVENPAIFYDPDSDQVLIAYSDQADSGKLQLVPFDHLSDLTFYTPTNGPAISLQISTGADTFGLGSNGRYGYIDTNGYEFGEQVFSDNLPDFQSDTATLTYDTQTGSLAISEPVASPPPLKPIAPPVTVRPF